MGKILFSLLFLHSFVFSQVGIGTTTPDNSAMLDVSSTIGGVLVPRMTVAQKTAIISPATGLLIYQTDGTSGFWYFDGTMWVTIGSAGWGLTGNTGTNAATDFVGTADNQGFVMATNNSERVKISSSGNVGINQTNPTNKLHITGTNPVFRIEDGAPANSVVGCDAGGYIKWVPNNLVLYNNDADWWQSASQTAPPINAHALHAGNVLIGRTGTTPYDLEINNGSLTGTTIGLGDNKVITDGNNETIFSHGMYFNGGSAIVKSLGNVSNRWTAVYATNGAIQTSDENLKKNIKPISYGINEVMQLNPITYYWKEEKCNSLIIPDAKKQLKLGFIAQEVENIIPEVVYTDTYKSKTYESDEVEKVEAARIGINYEELIPVLVKAKQEQNDKLIKLKAKAENLNSEIELLLKSK